ncbi:MAG: TIGR03936 family radical SAM-associated protein [Acidimicrobiales bacterium]
MRVRFRYAKLGKVRFTSQRDVARMWERALRRAALPIAYSNGFSPRPQLSFGLALPTTCESLAEYVDVAFDEDRIGPGGLEASTLPSGLSDLMPEGVEVVAAAPVERGPSSLQEQVSSCEWEIRLRGAGAADVEEMVGAFLGAGVVSVSRERKGRVAADDIRPSVLALAAAEVDGEAALVAETATHPRGIRPAELVQGIVVAAGAAGTGETARNPVIDRACRTKQWIERDGCRLEPLPAGDGRRAAGRAVHTVVCA